MAKKRASPQQPSLFKRSVPQMPEGYYSSGPNPNLARFVAEHASPYDPASDDYDVPPFDQPITTTKATAIYNMHTYWSKKPHDAIRQYIRHYTQPDGMVLDPFCGSGGTALAALMEGRAAIAIDLSPAATFITKNYCTPVDVDELQAAFAELEQRVKPEMEWLYETRCDRCEGRATTAYIIYSQVFQCSRCLEKVPLFDCKDSEGFAASGKPKNIKVCPHCYARGHVEEISTRDEKLGSIPVGSVYECEEGCFPRRAERYHNDQDARKRAYFEQFDLSKILTVESLPVERWVPHQDIRGVGTRYLKDGLHILGLQTVADLYTPRNLRALAFLRSQIPVEAALAIAFTSTSLSASKLYRHRTTGGGGPKGTDYYIAPINREMNVMNLFRRRFDNILLAQPLPVTTGEVVISTQSAIDLHNIPYSSVDYIFTDPPYSGTIQYGELNYVWECWLDFDTSWQKDEITINEHRQRDEEYWTRMMKQAMTECLRVLKPGRSLSLCYHDTSEGTWQVVQDIMAEVGFITEESSQTLYIDTGGGTYNQSTADKVTKRDLVINFRKPGPRDLPVQLVLFGDEDASTFADKARAILVDALEQRPGSTADRLYDTLVSHMVRQGTFERHDFEALLQQVAEPVAEPVMRNLLDAEPPNLFGTHESVRWYLRATADQVDAAESAREAAAAARLEAFMRGSLPRLPISAEKSEVWEPDAGVHYSDLFERYLPLPDKPRRLLADWLPEYFFKTAEGTWRPPADEAERAGLAALRTSGSLRRIKRFANALLAGVPPAARDHPASVADAADWIRQCRRAGLYALGRALYEKGGFAFATLPEEKQVEVEEEYQICVRRS